MTKKYKIMYSSSGQPLKKGHPSDAGFDICANNPSPITIMPGMTAIIPTGVSIQTPLNIEIQVRPRSGLAAKHSVTVLNSPGTIDPSYRGEIKIILINHGQIPFVVRANERIAQLVFSALTPITLCQTDTITTDTERSTFGLGSTGVNPLP